MENYIIVAIIIIILTIVIMSVVKRASKGKSCCSSGDYRPKRKKLSGIRYTKTFKVDGMHCEHCKGRVEECVNDIEGISGRVDLKKKELTVSYALDVDDGTIMSRIERAGYKISVL